MVPKTGQRRIAASMAACLSSRGKQRCLLLSSPREGGLERRAAFPRQGEKGGLKPMSWRPASTSGARFIPAG